MPTPLEQARRAAAKGNRKRAAYQAAAHDFRHTTMNGLAELAGQIDEDHYWALIAKWERFNSGTARRAS